MIEKHLPKPEAKIEEIKKIKRKKSEVDKV